MKCKLFLWLFYLNGLKYLKAELVKCIWTYRLMRKNRSSLLEKNTLDIYRWADLYQFSMIFFNTNFYIFFSFSLHLILKKKNDFFDTA